MSGEKKGWGSATKVQFFQAVPQVQGFGIEPPLGQYRIDVGRFHCVDLSNAFVAATVGTQLLAEGQVNVEADVPSFFHLGVKRACRLQLKSVPPFQRSAYRWTVRQSGLPSTWPRRSRGSLFHR